MTESSDSVHPGQARGRGRNAKRADGSPLRVVDLTGRERQLRAAMQAMGQVAARFTRAARRTLPFLARQRSRLVAQPVSIINPAEDPNEPAEGPSFDVLLEAEEMPAWASLTIGPSALHIVLEGSLGARTPGTSELGEELTLAQRVVIARVARSLADDFAAAVRDEVGLTLGVVSANARGAEEGLEPSGPDGLRVDCLFEDMPGDPSIRITISAEALETAARESHEDAPVAADPRMAEALRDVPVELRAELGKARIGLREVLELRVGQTLRLNTAIDDPVVIRVAGVGKLLGRPVVSRGQLAVEIRGRVEE